MLIFALAALITLILSGGSGTTGAGRVRSALASGGAGR